MAQENTANAGNTPTEEGSQNPSAEGSSEVKMFTQEQVNALVGNARTHERSKYPDYEKYKAAFEELEKLKDADKSELQKATERAEKAEAERNALQAEKDKSAWAQEVAFDYQPERHCSETRQPPFHPVGVFFYVRFHVLTDIDSVTRRFRSPCLGVEV